MARSMAGSDLTSHVLTSVLGVGTAVALLAVFVIANPAAGTTSTGSPNSTSMSVAGDLFNVAAEVAGVQYSIAQIAQNSTEVSAALALSPPSAPGANTGVRAAIGELVQLSHANVAAVSGIVQVAVAAFPDLAGQLKSDRVNANVTTAVAGLGHALRLLVTYAEKPNATTLDKFQSLLSTGESEWNTAVASVGGTPAPRIGGSAH